MHGRPTILKRLPIWTVIKIIKIITVGGGRGGWEYLLPVLHVEIM
jgi:hypothetical protein